MMWLSIISLTVVGIVSTVSGTAILDLAGDIKGIANELNHQGDEIIKEIAPALKLFDTPTVRVVSLSEQEEMDRNGTKLTPHGHAVDKDDQSISPAPVGCTTMKNPLTSQKYDTSAAAVSYTSNLNLRFEWRDFSTIDRYALVNGIKCLINKPASGKFLPA